MKTIFKRPRWFIVIATLCLVVITLFTTVGCDKSIPPFVPFEPQPETPPYTIDVENSFTDLPWLKAIADEITLIIKNGNPLAMSIYQCIYGDSETGFLIEGDLTQPFYNYNGEILCIMGGYAGETCDRLNIVSKELIWQINSKKIKYE